MERAINVGDALVGMVYQVLLDLRDHEVPPGPLLDVLGVFNATHLRMCEGQHWDLTYTCDADVSVGDYLEMVSRKTASPCVCIADAISILAGLPPATRETLRRFGESLGMLYQICDDIRGIWCEPDALGRQVGQDICQQRASLPLLYGFRHGSPPFREALSVKLAGQQALEGEDLEYIRRELNACGADVLCHRDASHHFQNATAALAALGKDGPESIVLRELLGACFASVDFGA
jgi:geranylgeranyl pyrophosphate synthase